MKIYLAGSIFYYGDVLRNTEWAKRIRDAFPDVDLYSPIENVAINGAEGKKKFAGSQEIANGDNERLNKTDILVACIDGDVLPSGTCAEIGKFHEKIERGEHKYIVGICTDNRQMYLTHSEAKNEGGAASLGEQQYSYQNLYVTGLIKQGGVLVSNIDDAIAFIKEKEQEFNNEVLEQLKKPQRGLRANSEVIDEALTTADIETAARCLEEAEKAGDEVLESIITDLKAEEKALNNYAKQFMAQLLQKIKEKTNE